MTITYSNVVLILLLFVCVLSSCNSREFKSEEELFGYLYNPENAYVQSKKINGVDIKLMYKPTDLLVNAELSDNLNEDSIEKMREKYGSNLYFKLSFSKNGQELLNGLSNNKEHFGKMVNELSFGLKDKIYLVTQNRDTINLLDYQYSRMFGASKSTSLLLVFPKEELLDDSQNLKVVVEDFGLDIGEIKFKFKTQQFNNQPQIIFN